MQRGRIKVERLVTRLFGTLGIVGIGVALGEILSSSKVSGWIIGLVVSGVTIVLAAILWSSRQFKYPGETTRAAKRSP
jgi:hypothetical protein